MNLVNISGASAQQIGESAGQVLVGTGTRIKVCGITEPREIDLLAEHRVDFVGLWLAVPGGPHDLPPDKWRALAERAASGPSPTPVLVTFAKDAEVLRGALAEVLDVDLAEVFVRKARDGLALGGRLPVGGERQHGGHAFFALNLDGSGHGCVSPVEIWRR